MPSKTLTSKQSWFSKAMFWQTMSSFAPIPIVYFIIMFLFLPMEIFMWDIDIELTHGVYADLSRYGDLGRTYGLSTAVMMGCISSMMVFRYLHNNRSSNMVHSLPITRNSLFLTQYLAGLCFGVVPNLAIFILTLGACAAHGIFYPTPFLYFFLVQTALFLFFYTLAVFCTAFTGSVGAVPIYYLLYNTLVAFITLLLQPLFELYYLGFTGSTFQNPLVQMLTPLYALIWGAKVEITKTPSLSGLENMYEPGGYFNPMPENISYSMPDIHILWIYLAVAVVMFAISLVAYSKRQIETAGEAVAFPSLKPLFRFGIAVLGGLSVGVLTWALAIPEADEEVVMYAVPLFSLFWSLVFGLVAEMILQKSFRVWKEWKRCLSAMVAIVFIFVGIGTDLFGYESYVPEFTELDSASIQGIGGYPADSGTMMGHASYGGGGTLTQEEYAIVSDLHSGVITQAGLWDPDAYMANASLKVANILVDYQKTSGFQSQRNYILSYDPQEEGVYQETVLSVLNNRDRLRDAYRFGEILESDITELEFSNLYDPEKDEVFIYGTTDLTEMTMVELQTMEREIVMALQRDFEEGNLGVKYLDLLDPDFLDEGLYPTIAIKWAKTTENDPKNMANTSEPSENQGLTSDEEGVATPLGDDGFVTDMYTAVVLNLNCHNTLEVLTEYDLYQEQQWLSNQEMLEKVMVWCDYSPEPPDEKKVENFNLWFRTTKDANGEWGEPDYHDPHSYIGIFG